MRVYGIVKNSSVDGPGIRYVVFLQGCIHNCPGCHNPESQLLGDEYGREMTVEEILEDMEKDPLIAGLTLSGGEPFLQPAECADLVDAVRRRFPNMDVWAWSGWTYEQLLVDCEKTALLEKLDVLVDGPFVLSLKDIECPWRGSSNQRLIDVPNSLKSHQSIILDEERWHPRPSDFVIRNHSKD